MKTKTESAFSVGPESGRLLCSLLEIEHDIMRQGIKDWLERMENYSDKQYGKGEMKKLLTIDSAKILRNLQKDI